MHLCHLQITTKLAHQSNSIQAKGIFLFTLHYYLKVKVFFFAITINALSLKNETRSEVIKLKLHVALRKHLLGQNLTNVDRSQEKSNVSSFRRKL